MSDKRKYTIEELDAIPLYKLRLILRSLSGTPSNKSAREMKEEILKIQEGEIIPVPTNRGRKPKVLDGAEQIFDDNGPVEQN